MVNNKAKRLCKCQLAPIHSLNCINSIVITLAGERGVVGAGDGCREGWGGVLGSV